MPMSQKKICWHGPPDLDLFHPLDIDVDRAIELAAEAEQSALQADKRIVNTEGEFQQPCEYPRIR